MFCGWGGMGWGGGFGNNGANSPGFQGYATRADINEGFAINGIDNGIRAIQNGLCDSTYAITNAVNSGFSAAELSRANQQAALMQQLTAMQMQAAECCCNTQRSIEGVRYDMAAQACDTRIYSAALITAPSKIRNLRNAKRHTRTTRSVTPPPQIK